MILLPPGQLLRIEWRDGLVRDRSEVGQQTKRDVGFCSPQVGHRPSSTRDDDLFARLHPVQQFAEPSLGFLHVHSDGHALRLPRANRQSGEPATNRHRIRPDGLPRLWITPAPVSRALYRSGMSQSADHGWRPEPPRVTLGRTPAPGQDWHGDSLRLPSEEVKIVRDLAEHTLRAEPQITATMRSLADEHELTLVGLGHRIKTFDSIAHKMATLRSENKTVPAALDKINDIVRYRIIVPDDRYSATVEAVTGQLHGAGQDLYNDWNAWSTDRYKGVNLTWQTTSGIRFETQFHTQQSHDACTKTRLSCHGCEPVGVW